jgi:hypothetical protein
MNNEIKIGARLVTKLPTYEEYEITAFIGLEESTDNTQIDKVCVTRVEKSDLAIKIDAFSEALKLDFEFRNTVFEEQLNKQHTNDSSNNSWRIAKKGCLWFSLDDFYSNFKFIKNR